jgi:nicotinamidase-related amidase
MHRKTLRLVASLAVVSLTVVSLTAGAAPRKPPHSPMDRDRTALVITDPQNDFLAESGIAYGLFADNLRELGTIDNLERLFRAAKKGGIQVFVSPHFYFPHDSGWRSPGALQSQLLSLGVFRRADPIDSRGFEGSGADFLARYKPYILDGKTIVTGPHKLFGPESNDLLFQLRSRGIDTVVLGGLAANLCTDSHLRALAEAGFKVLVVKDAVGAPGADAYKAALVNYGLIANGVLSTEEATALLDR